MSLDTVESTINTEKQAPRKWSISKYKCNINFTNKAFNFINVVRILYSTEIIDSPPGYIGQDDIPMAIYTY